MKASNTIVNYRVEFIAGLSTYMTMSYIFILNPVLLSQVGISVNAAFFATVIVGVISTLLMGLWAKVPFAAAPVPSITTFFVGYVCLTLGMPWEAALAAVFFSGLLSVLMAALSVKEKLLDNVSTKLSFGILCILCVFLIATGFKQAGLIGYSKGFFDISRIALDSEALKSFSILMTGLVVTLFFAKSRFKLPGAPILGILFATVVAFFLGRTPPSKVSEDYYSDISSTLFALDFSYFFETHSIDFVIAILIFFVIDFFAGVGKYIGLFGAIKEYRGDTSDPEEKEKFKRSLYVDGIGNIAGSFAGASSVAVYVSSAVGIAAGGKTGLTAVFIAIFMLLSLFFIPFVGAIPVIATTGVLIYIGFLLVSKSTSGASIKELSGVDLGIIGISLIVVFLTYSMDFAMAIVFSYYAFSLYRNSGLARENWIFFATALILSSAVCLKYFVI